MTGVLGVPTIEYLPYAFFNIINPLMALLFGFTGLFVERLPGPVSTDKVTTESPAPGRPVPE
jgi:NhaC family Na+:H+ antiporter